MWPEHKTLTKSSLQHLAGKTQAGLKRDKGTTNLSRKLPSQGWKLMGDWEANALRRPVSTLPNSRGAGYTGLRGFKIPTELMLKFWLTVSPSSCTASEYSFPGL